jgi:hypothetical protein
MVDFLLRESEAMGVGAFILEKRIRRSKRVRPDHHRLSRSIVEQKSNQGIDVALRHTKPTQLVIQEYQAKEDEICRSRSITLRL